MNQIGITDYLKAGYSHYFIQTEQMDRAIALLMKEIDEKYRPINVWGISPPKCKACGKLVLNPLVSDEGQFTCNCGGEVEEGANPMDPLLKLDNAPPNTVAVLKNYHWYIKNAHTGVANYELVQFIQDRLNLYKRTEARKIMIILSPVSAGTSLPSEIAKEFIPLSYGLPDEEEIGQILEYVIKSAEKSGNGNFKVPGKKHKGELIQSAKGMSRQAVEDAYSYSLVKTKGQLDPKVTMELSMKNLEEMAGVKYIQYTETFSNLLGYGPLKKFFLGTAHHPKAKGILLLGPSGTGKSHFAKAGAGELGMRMLTVEMGEWFGSLVGETEAKVRRAIEAIKAMTPCLVFVDEIEKGLAGTKGGGGLDAGHEVTQRAMAQWLKFMNDRPEGVYIIATCNNIQGLPPEYVRAERWDTAPFFVDLPNEEEKHQIFTYYQKEYKVDGYHNFDIGGWSGAEIKACCRVAHIMGTTIDKASEFIVPVSKTMEKEISALRKWAEGRTIPASEVKVNGIGERAIDLEV